MEVKDLALWSLGESWEYLTLAVDGLSRNELAYTPDSESTSLGFTWPTW